MKNCKKCNITLPEDSLSHFCISCDIVKATSNGITSLELKKNMWKLAFSAYEKFQVMNVACTLCNTSTHGTMSKVYHNVDGKQISSWKKEKDRSIFILIDHIIVCQNCMVRIPNGWMACRCKKEEAIQKQYLLI